MLILGNDLLLIMWSCCLVPWCMKHTIINNWNYLAGIPMSRSDQTAPAWTGNVEFAFVDVFVDVSVVKVNVYNAQTFSFTLVTLLYSLTIVLACCTHIYYRDLTNWNLFLLLSELSQSWSFDYYFETKCWDLRPQHFWSFEPDLFFEYRRPFQ